MEYSAKKEMTNLRASIDGGSFIGNTNNNGSFMKSSCKLKSISFKFILINSYN